jgi:hypothetical protein
VREATHPWWASLPEPPRAGGNGSEVIDDADPVEAFRAARRPQPMPPRAARGGTSREESQPRPEPETRGDPLDGARSETGTSSGSRASGSEPLEPPSSHRPELCGICPLCTLARALEDSRPDLLEHLTEAARHLAAAARSLLDPTVTEPRDAASGRPAEDGATGRARSGIERIPLDPSGPDGTDRGPGAAT